MCWLPSLVIHGDIGYYAYINSESPREVVGVRINMLDGSIIDTTVIYSGPIKDNKVTQAISDGNEVVTLKV